ncbi:MAG: hypothetical protein LLG14_13870 [Nocardiaceae bacterium]|nr:hypothetical protein [Nocardiaceae bacterium]
MVATPRTAHEVIAALTDSDWVELDRIVHRLNAHAWNLIDWVSPEEFLEDEWPQEVPLFDPVAEEAIEFIYRCLTFRDGRRLALSELRGYADGLVALLRKPLGELSMVEAVTRISVIAENDHHIGDAFAYAFDTGEIVDLLERLLDFRQRKAA